jgi:hypothetical protein
MMKSKLLPSLLSLAILATACSAQKAPPVSSSSLSSGQNNGDSKISGTSETPAQAVLKSLTLNRSGGGDLKFVIEQDSSGAGFQANVLNYHFKDQTEKFAIESEALVDGLKAIFSGSVKIEEHTTDPSALTGTWIEVILLDSNGKSETLKSPVIQSEKYSRTLEDLENAVREHMKKMEPESDPVVNTASPPKSCANLTDLSGKWVSEEQNESGTTTVADEISILESPSNDVKKYTSKKTITDPTNGAAEPVTYTLEYNPSTCIILQESADLKTSARRKVLEVSVDGCEIKSGICEDEQCLNVKGIGTARKS